MKNVLKVAALSLLILLIMSAGCSMQNSPLKRPHAEQQVSQDENQIKIDPELAGKAKEAAKTVRGVKESSAVAIDRDITVALKVNGFDRLRLKPIKTEVHDKIKQEDNKYNVHVTTDKKLFMQLLQLENQINAPGDKPLTDIQKKFNKINIDIQG